MSPVQNDSGEKEPTILITNCNELNKDTMLTKPYFSSN